MILNKLEQKLTRLQSKASDVVNRVRDRHIRLAVTGVVVLDAVQNGVWLPTPPPEVPAPMVLIWLSRLEMRLTALVAEDSWLPETIGVSPVIWLCGRVGT